MPYPRSFKDDGESLVLDVHGCTVPDALALIRRALEEGARRGRARLEVVHGYSTTRSAHDGTIKNALSDAVGRGDFERWVADARWDDSGGHCTLWFRIGLGAAPGRVTVHDLVGS